MPQYIALDPVEPIGVAAPIPLDLHDPNVHQQLVADIVQRSRLRSKCRKTSMRFLCDAFSTPSGRRQKIAKRQVAQQQLDRWEAHIWRRYFGISAHTADTAYFPARYSQRTQWLERRVPQVVEDVRIQLVEDAVTNNMIW